MPLREGKSQKVISVRMFSEMERGKPRKQAIAIALSKAGKSRPQKKAKGGMITSFSRIARPQRFEGVF